MKLLTDYNLIFWLVNLQAGESQWGTDEAEIQAILCSRSYPQLRATFQAYHGISEKDMEDAIKAETSGSLQSGYLAIVRYAKSPSAFFAERLYEAMKGLGTEEDAVTRIIVTRSEVSFNPKQIYHSIFGVLNINQKSNGHTA